MTETMFNDPTPADSPTAVLERTRQAYSDTGARIEQLTAERIRATEENKAANETHRKRMAEISTELTAARTAHAQWGRMLPRGDTARGNGTQ